MLKKDAMNNNSIGSVLQTIKTIEIPIDGTIVYTTAAQYLIDKCSPLATIEKINMARDKQSLDSIRLSDKHTTDPDLLSRIENGKHDDKEWIYVRFDADTGISVTVSSSHLVYTAVCMLHEDLRNEAINTIVKGKIYPIAIKKLRAHYNVFLTQYGRTAKGFDPEEYFENVARQGYSHVEVNGLAYPVPYESGPKGEVLHRFYTYCPALDQFVTSFLNKGIYKDDYLQANLNLLKKYAELAMKYGLIPGLLCFEPRSVPDEIFEKYPMLRGARVDHPIRSFKPRYNLSIAHPIVQNHYREMMVNIMREVPALGFISIWSNDSGAGFEYTNSLYVGRNGGGYVIREWKGEKEIAEAAALNLVRYLKILRDAGRSVNPEFRVLIRMEAFWHEHEHILEHLDHGIDVEVSSLLSKGWILTYRHPVYEDVSEVHTTVWHNRFSADEIPHIRTLNDRGAQVDFMYAAGAANNHEPLLGIPFPYLIADKLKDLWKHEVGNIAVLGGITPASFAPYNINQEVFRAFQLNPDVDIDRVLLNKATDWAGDEYAETLKNVWKRCDDVFRAYPIPIWLYTAWGVWFRTLVRPLIPNIEAIPEKERSYYEDFLISPPHNRARVDLRWDVGFELVDVARALQSVSRMDNNVLPHLKTIIVSIEELLGETLPAETEHCFRDLSDRLRGLLCWLRNQRNVAAWVAGVHGYIETNNETEKEEFRILLRDMILDEIDNTKQLLALWEESKTYWMYTSAVGETTYMYFDNFGELLKKKISYMTGRENDIPYIDPDYQWRVPGIPDEYIKVEKDYTAI